MLSIGCHSPDSRGAARDRFPHCLCERNVRVGRCRMSGSPIGMPGARGCQHEPVVQADKPRRRADVSRRSRDRRSRGRDPSRSGAVPASPRRTMTLPRPCRGLSRRCDSRNPAIPSTNRLKSPARRITSKRFAASMKIKRCSSAPGAAHVTVFSAFLCPSLGTTRPERCSGARRSATCRLHPR
jgi:hypothetical protein